MELGGVDARVFLDHIGTPHPKYRTHTHCTRGTSTPEARHLRRTGGRRSLSHFALVLRPAAQRRWNVESAATGAALTGGGLSLRLHRPAPLSPRAIFSDGHFCADGYSQLRFLKGTRSRQSQRRGGRHAIRKGGLDGCKTFAQLSDINNID